MVGEMGRAVRELEVPQDLRQVVERCLREVRKAK